MEAVDFAARQTAAAEARVRNQVRFEIGEAMTEAALREAMRCHSFDSYRQDVLRDSASTVAIAARVA